MNTIYEIINDDAPANLEEFEAWADYSRRLYMRDHPQSVPHLYLTAERLEGLTAIIESASQEETNGVIEIVSYSPNAVIKFKGMLIHHSERENGVSVPHGPLGHLRSPVNAAMSDVRALMAARDVAPTLPMSRTSLMDWIAECRVHYMRIVGNAPTHLYITRDRTPEVIEIIRQMREDPSVRLDWSVTNPSLMGMALVWDHILPGVGEAQFQTGYQICDVGFGSYRMERQLLSVMSPIRIVMP